MKSDMRRRIETSLALEHGASLSGFRACLREIAEQAALAALNEHEGCPGCEECEDFDVKQESHYIFAEYFGATFITPAAFRLEKDDDGWDHLHLYEIELSRRVSDERLAQYGMIADGDGPRVTLHIINSYGWETATLDSDTLMPFAYSFLYTESDWHEFRLELLRGEEGSASVPAAKHKPMPPIYTQKESERAILRAVYEMGLIEPGELL